MQARLILIDGTVYEGNSVGFAGTSSGEVVFNTSMTGYQEILTDPSYAGQLVALTYPLIGNYGVSARDVESSGPKVAGFIVREMSETPSNYASQGSGDDYLTENQIVGIQGIDVRALVLKLRDAGVMLGMITTQHDAPTGLQILKNLPEYDAGTYAREVSTQTAYFWADNARSETIPPRSAKPRVVVLDYGTKYNILRELLERGLEVVVLPCGATKDEIAAHKPDGIMLANGPGDPRSLEAEVEVIRQLMSENPKQPMFGICLGHQLLGRALGGETYKLKFGHRGANHPVKDLTTGKVHITSQNHGYALQADSLPQGVEVTHVNLNDNTVEGLRHLERPVFSVQYHPEASPGPKDNAYLFDRFAELVKAGK
ncbi:MAG: glutamine-hydrolyzing carbamoyl-phosphate synthase small subunit [Armatimonadetes bacterium]|nr:glutamine-hydrolyzing carbamoyl-phosphate synthase small subunit [Armatimonadota bacterium]